MATPEVLTALEKLHKELEQLEPALKHIEAAQRVTNEAGKLPALQLQLLKEVKEKDGVFKEELKSVFKGEVMSLASESRTLNKGVEILHSTTSQVLIKIESLVERLKDFYSKLDHIDFPERLASIENTAKETVSEVEKNRNATVSELKVLTKHVADVDFKGNFTQLRNVVDASAKSNKIVVDTLERQNLPQKIAEFQGNVQSQLYKGLKDLSDKSEQIAIRNARIIEDLNIPIRMDKLDASIVGIQASVMNLINKSDALERDVRDNFSRAQEQAEIRQRSIQTKLQMLVILVLLLIVGSAGSFFFLAFKYI